MFLCIALLLLFSANAGLAADLVPGPTVGLENDVLLGHPTDVDFGPDGRAYVLDSQLNTVHVLAPDGRYERSIGREGEGPGEFRGGGDIWVASDGVVHVVQSFPARIVRMNADGLALDDLDLRLEGMQVLSGMKEVSGARILERITTTIDDGTLATRAALVRVSLTDGKETELAFEASTMLPGDAIHVDENEGAFFSAWAAAEDGTLFWRSRVDEYQIHVLQPGARETTIWTRPDYVPIVRDEARIEEVRTNFLNSQGEVSNGGQFEFRYDPATNERVIRQFFPRPSGELWVHRDPDGLPGRAPGEDATFVHFDRFDSDGRFLGELRADAPAWLSRADLYFDGDHLVALHRPESDEDVPLSIASFRWAD